jgi:nucleotide-binding universal stress UspA family protein
MYDTILIPYDGSDEARKAVDHGLGLAEALGSKVHALYVMDLPGAPRALALRDDEEEIRQQYRDYGEKVTGEVAELAAERGLEAETALRSGSVSREIVRYAKEEGMDAIVMGSAYRGTLGGILGSTTDKVVRTATVPVITQRMQVDEI